MGGDEVVRILRQLPLGEHRRQMRDLLGRDEQQQQAADQLHHPFKPLAMMPISKTRSSQSFGLNIVSRPTPVKRRRSVSIRLRGRSARRRRARRSGSNRLLAGLEVGRGVDRGGDSRGGRGCGARGTSGGAGPGSAPPPRAPRGCTCRCVLPCPARRGTCRSRRGTLPTPLPGLDIQLSQPVSVSLSVASGGQHEQGPGGCVHQRGQPGQQRLDRRQVRHRPGRLPQGHRTGSAQLPPHTHPVTGRFRRHPSQQHQPPSTVQAILHASMLRYKRDIRRGSYVTPPSCRSVRRQAAWTPALGASALGAR